MAAADTAGSNSVVLLGGVGDRNRGKGRAPLGFRSSSFCRSRCGGQAHSGTSRPSVLSGQPGRGRARAAAEIRRANLHADLVLLSACETAVGKIEGEEGVANLAHTFLVAGAKSVVASTWRVNDRTTATLMAQMYSYLTKGEPVASALRHAQLDMLRDFGANTPPFYWDGLLVIGHGARTVSFRSASVDAQPAGAFTIRPAARSQSSISTRSFAGRTGPKLRVTADKKFWIFPNPRHLNRAFTRS